MRKFTVFLWVLVLAAGGLSTMFYLRQGGFGIGQATADEYMFLLSLPWSVMIWPVTRNDLLSFVVVPFAINAALVLLFGPRAAKKAKA